MRISILILIAYCLFAGLAEGTENQDQPLDTLKIQAEVDSLFSIGDSLKEAKQYEEALIAFNQALIQADVIKEYRMKIELLSKIGFIHYEKGQLRDALTNWKNAVTMAQEIGDKKLEGRNLRNVALIHFTRMKYADSVEYLQRSLEALRNAGDQVYEANALVSLGRCHRRIGKYNEALEYYKESLIISREIGDRVTEIYAINGIGVIYHDIGDFSQAKEYFQTALEYAIEGGDRINLGIQLLNMGLCSDDSLALEYFHQSANIAREVGYHQLEADAMAKIGNIHGGRKEYIDALKAYQSTLKIGREFDIPYYHLFGLRKIGNLYITQEKFAEALEVFNEALVVAEEGDEIYSIEKLYYDIGLCYLNLKCDSLAVTYFSKCIDFNERVRGELKAEAQRRSYGAFHTYAYSDIIEALLNLARIDETYNYAERCRARSFLDLLASGDVTVGKSRHAEFLQNEEDYYEREDEIEEQIAAVADDTVQVAMLRGKLEEEWESIDALIEEKKMYEPELASMVTVNPLTLPEVQELVDPKSTILEYFLTEDKTLIWFITADEMEVFQVEVGGDSIAILVKDYRDAILTEGMLEERSKALYEILIAPAEDKIEAKQLIIIPHGILHYLPFHALQNEKGKYLIDRYHLSYLPSASVMKYLEPKKRPKGETLLAFGNPTTDMEGYKSIPYAEQEVENIAEFYDSNLLLFEEEATEGSFRELAPNYDILHLACHSELNSAYPLFSGLLLAPGEEQDGELDVHELFTMDLNAYLVVLSACQTGLGHLTTGDELVGLSRAFIYAGTPSVVSSLWVVKDESTAYLMTQFHKNLQKYDKAEALRRAQLKTKKKYKSPYHWASFVLIGSPD